MAEDKSPNPGDIAAVLQNDLLFVRALVFLGETHRSNPELWGRLLLDRHDPQIVRRLHVRLVLSLIESVVASLKKDALGSSRLSAGERTLLTDTTYELSSDGDLIERTFFAPLLKTLRFAFRCYAKAHALDYSPDYSGPGWQALQSAVKIRNRITHPRKLDEMSISDTEMQVVDSAHAWFMDCYRGLLGTRIADIERLLDR
jgi:hypothetical protein